MAVQDLWAANALWPGQAIVARLRQQVRDLRQVLMVEDYDPEQPSVKQMPAAIVLLYGLSPRVARDVYTQPPNCDHDWMVALAVRSARADADADSTEVGVLMPKVVSALHGWSPAESGRRFLWNTGPRPAFGRNASYYPLIFSIREVMA